MFCSLDETCAEECWIKGGGVALGSWESLPEEVVAELEQ